MEYEFLTKENVERTVVAVWSSLTSSPSGSPVSREACIFLLSLATVLPASRIAGMKLGDLDFEHSVWHVPRRKREQLPTVPLTRLTTALIGHAYSFRGDRDGDYLFPGHRDPSAPVSGSSLLRAFRRAKIKPRQLLASPGYDLPTLAIWIMAFDGVPRDANLAAAHRRVDLWRISEFNDPYRWAV